MNNINIHAQREIWNNDIAVYISRRSYNRVLSIAQPLVFVETEDYTSYKAPAIRLQLEEAQLLIDELWNCGLRPSEGTGSAGSLAATERHLKDMQKIAFKFLEK